MILDEVSVELGAPGRWGKRRSGKISFRFRNLLFANGYHWQDEYVGWGSRPYWTERQQRTSTRILGPVKISLNLDALFEIPGALKTLSEYFKVLRLKSEPGDDVTELEKKVSLKRTPVDVEELEEKTKKDLARHLAGCVTLISNSACAEWIKQRLAMLANKYDVSF
jgi:hypothetical protein